MQVVVSFMLKTKGLHCSGTSCILVFTDEISAIINTIKLPS